MREWTEEDTKSYRQEVERRFRSRTPAKDILDVRLEDRVNRSEMRSWCIDTIGVICPEVDRDWVKANALWYRQMAKRVIKELDPESYDHEFRKRNYRPSPIW